MDWKSRSKCMHAFNILGYVISFISSRVCLPVLVSSPYPQDPTSPVASWVRRIFSLLLCLSRLRNWYPLVEPNPREVQSDRTVSTKIC